MSTIILHLPSGDNREATKGTTAFEVASSISTSLGKNAVAVYIDGDLCDLSTKLDSDAKINFITKKNDVALELIRHDLAHIMAQAVTELYPEAKPTIGPVITDGFFYDYSCPEPFTEEVLAKIEKKMRKIVDEGILLEREEWDREKARSFFQERNEPYKVELVDAIPEGELISIYRQGPFLDLCRGPHMPSTRHAGKAFKLTSVAGSYWRGDSNNEQLQRIYGTAWRNEDELRQYLHLRAEAERRDHRKLGRSMNLFHLQDESAGSVFWHQQGWSLYRGLESYMRKRLEQTGYQEINTPQIISRTLWEKSGHWSKFRDNMYLVESEQGITDYVAEPDATSMFGLKPMNCPGHVMVFAQGSKSYRDLPLRFAEFGRCHRCEPRGALHGIMRVRAFTQDDGHIFCTAEQVVDETARFLKLLNLVYKDLGFDDYKIKYSDRPDVRAGSDETWDLAEQSLLDACKESNVDYELNPGEGAFYGPKLEFVLTDALGREWQCGTLQVDFVLPESLGAEYTSKDGSRTKPVMLHRAILGSFERFIGILIEHTDGHLALWLCSPQLVIATITSSADEYADTVFKAMEEAGIRVKLDKRNEKINYKVREHSAAKVPLIAVVGEKESKEKTLTLRRLGSRETVEHTLDEAIALIKDEAIAPHEKE